MFRNRTGWAFVVLYLVLAAVLFPRASTCSGWVCDLVALPAAVPVGLLLAPLLDFLDDVFVLSISPVGYFRDPAFIAATVLGNAVCYYGLGVLASRLAGWVKARVSTSSSVENDAGS
jgi:hypothetical protein